LTDEAHLAVFYRLILPSGEVYAVQVTPLSPDIGSLILPAASADSTLVTPLQPRGQPWWFMPRYNPAPDYVRDKLAVPDRLASLLAALMPLLVAIAPADLLAEAADKWFQNQP